MYFIKTIFRKNYKYFDAIQIISNIYNKYFEISIYRKIRLLDTLCISPLIYLHQMCKPINIPKISPLRRPSPYIPAPSPEYSPIKFVKFRKHQIY